MDTNRREFIKKAGIAGIAFSTAKFDFSGKDFVRNKMTDKQTSFNLNKSLNNKNMIDFISPIDGDMLHEYDGTVSGKDLIIKVKIQAPSGSNIKINKLNAKYIGGIYEADLKLNKYENTIELSEGNTGFKKKIKVYRLTRYVNKYRLSLDDNIWFMKDLNENAHKYNSLFENPYMGALKRVHDKYKTKIHINLYYQTEGFNLSQMTDKYKREWKANADWLGLSFHALANDPDKPYINAGYEQVKRDCILVQEQIKRFAGKELMGPETTIHWGEATVEGCRALKDRGYTIFAGYFNVDDNKPPVSYYLTEDQRRHLKQRFIWRDNKEGLIFSRIAQVINAFKIDKVIPDLDEIKNTFNPRYIDLMIHEQYFYPHYVAYQPDWEDKVMTAVKWAHDNGFRPGFLKESVLA